MRTFSKTLIFILTGIDLCFMLFIPVAFIGMWLWNASIPVFFVPALFISLWQIYEFLRLLKIMISYSTISK